MGQYLKKKHLYFPKFRARQKPHPLTEKQKRVRVEKNYLKSKIIAMDDVYQKQLQPMKHSYIIINLRGKFNKMWLSKKTRRPVIAKRFQSRQKVLYEYCVSLLRDRVQNKCRSPPPRFLWKHYIQFYLLPFLQIYHEQQYLRKLLK